jgi:signal transduction histidine kinase
MINYTSNMGIILDINLIIIMALIVNSIYIGFFEKFKNIKYVNILYFVEFAIYMVLIYDKKHTSIHLYIVYLYTFGKVTFCYVIKDKLKFKKVQSILILVLNILNLIYISLNIYLYFTTNLVINLLICKFVIIDKIKARHSKLEYKVNKINRANQSINIINNRIRKEKVAQIEYKEDILNIEENINKAIEESDMPIVILNENNDIIYCNKNSWKDKNINSSKLNLLGLLDKNFKNGRDCIDIINNIKVNRYDSINLYSYEDKVYRFICTKEERENKVLKTCIFNDITQSTLIQKQLNDSEEKYRKLMDILIDGVIIHDIDSINYINNSAIHIFNVDDKIENINMEDIKNKLGKSNIKKLNDSLNIVKKGKVKKTVNKFKTIDNTYIEFITTKIENTDSDILLSIVVDITEMEIALKQLEGSKKTYQALAQNLPDGIIVIDKKRKEYIYQNRSMIKILKKVKIESINKCINDYISNEYYGQTKRYDFNKDKNYSIEITIADMDKENQLMVIIRSLEYEDRVLEAIRELDLVNAQHHVKNEFLINTSKCLKDPIENIISINKILESNKLKYKSNQINNYTNLVKRNCYRLKRLIRNIGEVVDVENGVCSTKFVYCDIVEFTKNIIQCANNYLYDKGITIKFKSEIDYSILKIDIDKMERIILNLISNAIKFNEDEHLIEVHIAKNKEYIKIIIKDNGMGIPKDRLKFIFTKFGQVDKTLSRSTEGCGVGLSLVKAFVDLHKGSIKVESEEGKGSKFTVSLKEIIKIKNKTLIDLNEYKLHIEEKMHIEFADIYF